tara:strand:+ start:280 stop:495 length:216 start_codon:yes stop_codon:yes gene_type:complete
MILTSHSETEPGKDLCNFLQHNLGVSDDALALGIRQSILENAPLPIILRNFGLITLEQYQEILNWQNDNQY